MEYQSTFSQTLHPVTTTMTTTTAYDCQDPYCSGCSKHRNSATTLYPVDPTLLVNALPTNTGLTTLDDSLDDYSDRGCAEHRNPATTYDCQEPYCSGCSKHRNSATTLYPVDPTLLVNALPTNTGTGLTTLDDHA